MKAFPKSKTEEPYQDGMDLRDYFAAKAMQAIYSNEELRLKINDDVISRLRNVNETVSEQSIELEFAKEYYLIADAMLEARQ